jgi:tetratricopeptide (TPR) repeat protein
MIQDNFTIRLSLSVCLLFTIIAANAQTAYDFDHSRKFGLYLYNTGQYELAVQEFERAVFYLPSDSAANSMLFKTYAILGQTAKAVDGYVRFTHDADLQFMPNEYGSIYANSLIQRGEYLEALSFINRNCCLAEKDKYYLSVLLVRKEWEMARDFAATYDKNNPAVLPLIDITNKTEHIKHRSPFLGALFSAIVPGSGKLYAGNWQDALIGFIMTTGSGIVAYRAYDKYGINNPYTWFAGTLAIGYYSGNIYGGYNTAKKYNLRHEDELVNETKRIISDF